MRPVTIRVPGSTSNCGAGFDTLGLALQIYNEVTLAPLERPGARALRECDGRAAPLVAAAAKAFDTTTGRTSPGFTYQIEGKVPVSRGLGSSVTVLAGVLAGLNHWAGRVLAAEDMVRLLTRIEGHPDNAAAGVWGGFCVSRSGDSPADFADVVRAEIPDHLKFVVASPDQEVATPGAREALPAQISHRDAVRSLNSAAYLTAAFVSGDYAKLKDAVVDFMHEPHRLPGIAGGRESIAAGVEAGGLTGWLSGSGSSVLCVAEASVADRVGSAMAAAFAGPLGGSVIRILAADNRGLSVVMDQAR